MRKQESQPTQGREAASVPALAFTTPQAPAFAAAVAPAAAPAAASAAMRTHTRFDENDDVFSVTTYPNPSTQAQATVTQAGHASTHTHFDDDGEVFSSTTTFLKRK